MSSGKRSTTILSIWQQKNGELSCQLPPGARPNLGEADDAVAVEVEVLPQAADLGGVTDDRLDLLLELVKIVHADVRVVVVRPGRCRRLGRLGRAGLGHRRRRGSLGGRRGPAGRLVLVARVLPLRVPQAELVLRRKKKKWSDGGVWGGG